MRNVPRPGSPAERARRKAVRAAACVACVGRGSMRPPRTGRPRRATPHTARRHLTELITPRRLPSATRRPPTSSAEPPARP